MHFYGSGKLLDDFVSKTALRLITILGIGSMIGTFEGVLTPINETFSKHPTLKKIPKSMVCLLTVILHFLLGLIFCTDAGNYWVDLFNNYAASIVLLTMGKLRLVTKSYVFSRIL